MTNNEFVEKLFIKYDELIKICRFNNIHNSMLIDEIIQITFEKLLMFENINKYVKDGQPNMFIIFMILKNFIINYRKSEQKIDSNEFDPIKYDKEDDSEYVHNKKYDYVINEIDKIDYWFDREIVKLYVFKSHTIRSLSKETGLNYNTIQPIIHNFFCQCRNNYDNQKSKINVFN